MTRQKKIVFFLLLAFLFCGCNHETTDSIMNSTAASTTSQAVISDVLSSEMKSSPSPVLPSSVGAVSVASKTSSEYTASKKVSSVVTSSGGLTQAEVENLRIQAADLQRQIEEEDVRYVYKAFGIRAEINELNRRKQIFSRLSEDQKQIDMEIQSAQSRLEALTAEHNAKMEELQRQLDEINVKLKDYPVSSVVTKVSSNPPVSSALSDAELLEQKIQELVRLKEKYAYNKKVKETEIENIQRLIEHLHKNYQSSMAAVYEQGLEEDKKELERLIQDYEAMIRALEAEIAALEAKLR